MAPTANILYMVNSSFSGWWWPPKVRNYLIFFPENYLVKLPGKFPFQVCAYKLWDFSFIDKMLKTKLV
jgi:hypothetical protein